MANIPSAAQMATNPSMYALRGIGGVSSSIGRMSVELNGQRVALTPEAVRKAQAIVKAGSTPKRG